MATTTSGSAPSRDVFDEHSRAHVLHLIDACCRFCGFGRTLVVSADQGTAIRLRSRGLRAEYRDPEAARQTAARDRGRFEAVVVLDADAIDGAAFASIVAMASRWVFVAGTEASGRTGVDRASLAARCRAAGWVEATSGPLASDSESNAVLCAPADHIMPGEAAELIEWSAAFVRPNDYVVFLDPPPAAAIDFLWTHTEAARIGTFDREERTTSWLRRSSDEIAGRRFVDVIIATEEAASGLDHGCVSMLCPGGRLLIAAAADRAIHLPHELIDECASPSERQPGTTFRSFMRTPLGCEGEPYLETVLPAPGHPPVVADFASHYVNPWVVHALIIGRFRLRDARGLARLTHEVIATCPPDSADAGGTLCVLAYQALMRNDPLARHLAERIDAYLTLSSTNPHVGRWQISLRFVVATLAQQQGRFDDAECGFAVCARADFMRFAPHLGTKCAEAAFQAGWLAWQRGDVDAAETYWRVGVDVFARVGHTPVEDLLIDPQCPSSYEAGDGLREVTTIADHAWRCANGLRAVRHRRTRGAARPDVINRSLQETAHELAGHLRQAQTIAVERLGRLHQQERVHAAAIGERDRTLAGHVLLLHGLRQEVAKHQAAAARRRQLASARATRTTRRGIEGMQRLLVFGSGRAGQFAAEALSRHHSIEAFLDNRVDRQNGTLCGYPILAPADLDRVAFDGILVSTVYATEVVTQLQDLGVPDDQIILMSEALDGLAVFGAGAGGQRVWESVPSKTMIRAFIDNAADKHGQTLNGIPIASPATLATLDPRYIVVASIHRAAIERQLSSLGVASAKVLAIDASRPPSFVPSDQPAIFEHVRLFHDGLSDEELGRLQAFGASAPRAALVDFEPLTLAVGTALASAGCRVTAFGAPAFVDTCETAGISATSEGFGVEHVPSFPLIVAGSRGWPSAIAGTLTPSHRLIATPSCGLRAHVRTASLAFWYAPPRPWLAEAVA